MRTAADLGHVKHRHLIRLAAYWLDLRRGRRMPARADIDPVDIPAVLPHLWICDYLAAERRFRYRLTGEEINAVFGANLAGRYLDEVIEAERADRILSKFFHVVEDPCIVHDKGRVYLKADRPATGERIMLPLSDDDAAVNAVVGATYYRWQRAAETPEPADRRQVTTLTPVDAAGLAPPPAAPPPTSS